MWADNYIKQLQSGQTISFRPRGNSMTPIIKSGQLVTVKPFSDPSELSIGTIVLCKVSGTQYLHKISAINEDRIQISNNHGHVNGWTNINKIYGIVIEIHA